MVLLLLPWSRTCHGLLARDWGPCSLGWAMGILRKLVEKGNGHWFPAGICQRLGPGQLFSGRAPSPLGYKIREMLLPLPSERWLVGGR